MLHAYNSIFYENSVVDNIDVALEHKYELNDLIIPESDERLLELGLIDDGVVYHSGDALFVDATNYDTTQRNYELATLSIAFDKGDSYYFTIAPDFDVDYSADLAGNDRVMNSAVDIGAYEKIAAGDIPSIIVTTLEDVVDPEDGKISLREAVEYYFDRREFPDRTFNDKIDPEGNTVTFDPSLEGKTIQLNGKYINIGHNMTIFGGNVPTITIDGNRSSRLFRLDVKAFVTFQGLIFKNGVADQDLADKGGAIFAYDAELTVKNSIFENNYASDAGGAIYTYGRLAFDDVEFRENDAANSGSAFFGQGRGGIFVNRITVTNNGTNENVPAVALSGQRVYVVNSLVANNSGPAFSVKEAERWPETNAFFINDTIADSDRDGDRPVIVMDSVSRFHLLNSIVYNAVPVADYQLLLVTNGAAVSNAYPRGAEYSVYGETNESGGAIYATTANVTVKNTLFAANNGYVGGAIFVNGGTLSVENSTFDSNWSSFQGGAVAVYATEGVNTTSLNVVDSQFLMGSSERAGAVYFKDGVAKIENSTLANNNAQYANGGALVVANGSVSIKDTSMTNNVADRFGGAIFAGNSTVTINNSDVCSIEGNGAQYGGAIYNSKGTVVVEAGKFASNSATLSGGAIYSAGALTANGTFENNASSENGGAVFAIGDVTVTGGSFANNDATKSGGAIYAASGNVAITNAAFTGNTTQTAGGAALRLAKSTTATIGNATFTSNTAAGAGGAINASATKSLTITGGSFVGNKAKNTGGAIHATTGTAISSVGANFDGNTTTKFGGAIAAVGQSTLTVTGGVFEKSAASAGGAIYVSTSEATLTNATLSANTATLYGAGVYSVDSEIVSTGTAFAGNTATQSGGAIFVSEGSLSLTGATLSGNAATSGFGGAICVDTLDDLTVAGSTLTENTAGSSGGAIYAVDTKFNLVNTTDANTVLSGNKSNKFGGAIYVLGGKAEIGDVAFNGNTSVTGGAIYAQDDIVSLTGATFAKNTATERGGAVFASNADATLAALEFTENSATLNGGAFYAVDSDSEVLQTTFAQNASDIGGAIYQAFGTLEVETTLFSKNTANSHGGAFYQIKGESFFTEAVFNANEATTKAGALYVGAGSTTVSRSTFTDNKASLGGAISILQASSVEVDNSLFAGNSATQAAALGLGSSAWFKLANVTIADNVGSNAVRITGSTGEIVNSIIALNSGTDVLFKSGEVTANNTLSPFADWTDGKNPEFDALGSLFEADSYELSADSQALDAGSDAAVVGPLDLNGNARKVGTVDIGAFERQNASSALLDEAFAELFLEELD